MPEIRLPVASQIYLKQRLFGPEGDLAPLKLNVQFEDMRTFVDIEIGNITPSRLLNFDVGGVCPQEKGDGFLQSELKSCGGGAILVFDPWSDAADPIFGPLQHISIAFYHNNHRGYIVDTTDFFSYNTFVAQIRESTISYQKVVVFARKYSQELFGLDMAGILRQSDRIFVNAYDDESWIAATIGKMDRS